MLAQILLTNVFLKELGEPESGPGPILRVVQFLLGTSLNQKGDNIIILAGKDVVEEPMSP